MVASHLAAASLGSPSNCRRGPQYRIGVSAQKEGAAPILEPGSRVVPSLSIALSAPLAIDAASAIAGRAFFPVAGAYRADKGSFASLALGAHDGGTSLINRFHPPSVVATLRAPGERAGSLAFFHEICPPVFTDPGSRSQSSEAGGVNCSMGSPRRPK